MNRQLSAAWQALACCAVVLVTIQGMKFNPDVVEVHPGDTVEWVNQDIVPHTVTADGPKKAFDSGVINMEKKFRFKARKPGEIPYSCSLHPTMHGKIVVAPKSGP